MYEAYRVTLATSCVSLTLFDPSRRRLTALTSAQRFAELRSCLQQPLTKLAHEEALKQLIPLYHLDPARFDDELLPYARNHFTRWHAQSPLDDHLRAIASRSGPRLPDTIARRDHPKDELAQRDPLDELG
jgi:hypothetical protein